MERDRRRAINRPRKLEAGWRVASSRTEPPGMEPKKAPQSVPLRGEKCGRRHKWDPRSRTAAIEPGATPKLGRPLDPVTCRPGDGAAPPQRTGGIGAASRGRRSEPGTSNLLCSSSSTSASSIPVPGCQASLPVVGQIIKSDAPTPPQVAFYYSILGCDIVAMGAPVHTLVTRLPSSKGLRSS